MVTVKRTNANADYVDAHRSCLSTCAVSSFLLRLTAYFIYYILSIIYATTGWTLSPTSRLFLVWSFLLSRLYGVASAGVAWRV